MKTYKTLTIAPYGEVYLIKRNGLPVGCIEFDAGSAPWIVRDLDRTILHAEKFLQDARAWARKHFLDIHST